MKFSVPKPNLRFIADFLNAREPRERLLLMVFAAAFLFFADYFLWLGPTAGTFMRTLPALSSSEAQLDELREDKKNGTALKKKWEEVRGELEDKESRIGASDEIASLLEDLSKLASESGVRILSLKPIENLNPSSGKLYYSVPIQISAMAGMHELGAFMNRLETGTIFFKITDMKIAANPANERKHSAEMMVETYRKV